MNWTDKYKIDQVVWVAHRKVRSEAEPGDKDGERPLNASEEDKISSWKSGKVSFTNSYQLEVIFSDSYFNHWWVYDSEWVRDVNPNGVSIVEIETETRCCDCGEPTIYPQMKNVANGFACYSCRTTNSWKH